MKLYSIKSKLLLAFAALLTIITLLNALQMSYVMNRRGEEEAFAQLSRRLTLFEQELGGMREVQTAVALDAARDDKNLSDMAILYAQALRLRQQSSTVLESTFCTNKAVSLNRLQIILDSAGLASAAVYLDHVLSHYITRDQAGMVSRRNGHEALVGTRRNEDGSLTRANWRTWRETALPGLVPHRMPVVDRVTVTFEFPSEGLMVLRTIVPVQGTLRESFLETIAEHVAVAVPATMHPPQSGGQTPQLIGAIVFNQVFDTDFLRGFADRTGMVPAIFSPDGQRALQFHPMGNLLPALLPGPAHRSILTRTMTLGGTSYYQAFTAWQINGEPALVLGGALSREGTLAMIRQTITTTTGTAVLIFLVVGTVGYLILTRIVAPITNLTAAVSGIGLTHARKLEPTSRQMTLQIALGHYLEHRTPARSNDEIGALTSAFNAMAEQLYELIRNLETRVQRRTAQLETANKELEAFAYSVSHDLRAPLRHIDGFLELLQKKIEATIDEQGRHYLDAICDSSRKMGMLIDDLLSFSRMGRHAMSIRSVDLGPLVRDVIDKLAPDAAGREIAWRIGDLPAVRGDATLLRMVLGNLLENALKFTRPRQQAEIEIGSMQDEETERTFFVRDNGVGFDMTYADKLFGVFQRLHREEEFEGTGIGLANVRRIIARHGGRTWAQGAPGQGSTIYFSLPHSTPQEVMHEQSDIP